MKKIRLGIVGAGGAGYGGVVASNGSPYLELVAISEINDERRKFLEKKTGVKGYKDYRELLKRDDIDLVYNATPNFLHAEITVEALKSEKHVFTEKPMALTKEDVKKILKEEKKSGKCVQVNFEMRFSIMPKRMKDLVDEGEIGTPKNIYFIHAPGGVGFKKKGKDWRADKKKVGGYYLEEGCHRLDIFRYWMADEVIEVEAIPAPDLKGKDSWHRGYREPAVTLCFFKNGKLAVLVTHQHMGAGIIEIPGTEPLLAHQYQAKIAGDKGSMFADFWEKIIKLFYFTEPEGKAALKRIESYEGIDHYKLHHFTTGFINEFAKRLLKGEKPFMSASDSARTMAVVFACEESFKKGKRVKVDYKF